MEFWAIITSTINLKQLNSFWSIPSDNKRITYKPETKCIWDIAAHLKFKDHPSQLTQASPGREKIL